MLRVHRARGIHCTASAYSSTSRQSHARDDDQSRDTHTQSANRRAMVKSHIPEGHLRSKFP